MKACGFALAAVLWFWFGIEKHDKNTYLPRVGWMVLDSAEYVLVRRVVDSPLA